LDGAGDGGGVVERLKRAKKKNDGNRDNKDGEYSDSDLHGAAPEEEIDPEASGSTVAHLRVVGK
jgi:hypothetical protein